MYKIIAPEDIKLNKHSDADTLQGRKVWIADFLADIGINRSLKILIGTNSLGCGGQENQVMRLIPELKKLGFEVEHMYYSPPHDLADKYAQRGIKSLFIDKNELGKLACLKKQISFIRANNFDIVHAFGGTANIYIRGAAVLARNKVILGSSRDRAGFGGFGSVAINSILNLFTSAWVMNSRSNIDGLGKLKFLKKKRLYLLPNGLEIADAQLSDTGDVDKDLLEWIDGRVIAASAGRICEVKNYDLFIDAAKRVHERFPDSCFLIIGGADCREEGAIFQKRLSDRIKTEKLDSFVRMTGRMEHIEWFYPYIDLFVLTSNYEGCPNVVLEAMRASKPIVMTNSCDTSLIIKEGENGFVVEVGDVDGLTEKIVCLLDSKQKRKEFGMVSRQIIESGFSVTESAWTLAKIYLNELYCKKK